MLDFNRRKLDRNKDLIAQRNVSANDEDEMATDVKKDEAILHQVTAKLEMKTIRSPVDGVVVKVDLSAGEYVGEKPIMTVAQIDPLNVEVIVPVSEYGIIKKGMLAEVHPELPVGGLYIGKVTIVDRVVNAASGSFGVRVELPNPKLAIPSGLRCTVHFKGGEAPQKRLAAPAQR
jgi:multidrug efflux pump subunit AcrA (membrane-fusion protein)